MSSAIRTKNTIFTTSKYVELLERVIEWNRVANEGKIQTDVDNQVEFTVDELIETEQALVRNDHTEVIDGVCDVFVTGAYLCYQLDEYKLPTESEVRPDHHTVLIFGQMMSCVVGEVVIHSDIMKLCNWCIDAYGEKRFVDYLEAVLKSNESKFVPDSDWDEEKEVTRATEIYRERGYSNIMGVEGSLNGKKVWILRADNGKGKILKPSTFAEPTDFL